MNEATALFPMNMCNRCIVQRHHNSTSDDVEMDQLNHSAVESDGAAEVDEEAHSNR
jgi:hypothetical protein